MIVATGKYIGEGFDEPRLDTLFLAMPFSWEGTLAQYVGRLHRNYDGKQDVRVYDYVDVHVPMLERMYQNIVTVGAFLSHFVGGRAESNFCFCIRSGKLLVERAAFTIGLSFLQ